MKKIFKIEQVFEGEKPLIIIDCPDDDAITQYFEDNEIELKIKGSNKNEENKKFKVKIKKISKNGKKIKVEMKPEIDNE